LDTGAQVNVVSAKWMLKHKHLLDGQLATPRPCGNGVKIAYANGKPVDGIPSTIFLELRVEDDEGYFHYISNNFFILDIAYDFIIGSSLILGDCFHIFLKRLSSLKNDNHGTLSLQTVRLNFKAFLQN